MRKHYSLRLDVILHSHAVGGLSGIVGFTKPVTVIDGEAFLSKSLPEPYFRLSHYGATDAQEGSMDKIARRIEHEWSFAFERQAHFCKGMNYEAIVRDLETLKPNDSALVMSTERRDWNVTRLR